jgi:hypothetical protein
MFSLPFDSTQAQRSSTFTHTPCTGPPSYTCGTRSEPDRSLFCSSSAASKLLTRPCGVQRYTQTGGLPNSLRCRRQLNCRMLREALLASTLSSVRPGAMCTASRAPGDAHAAVAAARCAGPMTSSSAHCKNSGVVSSPCSLAVSNAGILPRSAPASGPTLKLKAKDIVYSVICATKFFYGWAWEERLASEGCVARG